MLARRIVYQEITRVKQPVEPSERSILDYPKCNGRLGSSSGNWVPVDFIGYHISRFLHITDEDLEKK